MNALARGDGPSFGAPHDEATLQRMIAEQDANDIDVQILSTGPNNPYLKDEGRAKAAAREVNDAYGDLVDRHAGRFAAFGSLPLPHAEAAAEEAVRCLDELGLAGIHLGCSALGTPLDDPAYAEMWTELDRREAIVYVHPGGLMVGTAPGLAGLDAPVLAVTIGSAAALATSALRLAVLCRTHRRLRVIIGLLGGSLPFLLQRVAWIGDRWKGPSALSAQDREGSIIAELRRFSYDVNLLPDPSALVSARAAYGIERLLFGSDAPGLSPRSTTRFMRDGGLSEDECRAVLGENPTRLFGRRLGFDS